MWGLAPVNIFNPDNWMDVFTIIVVTGMVSIPAWLSAVKAHKGIQEVKDQVVNGHKTPMRADLDRCIAAIEALAHDVNGLRKDLSMEEDRRRIQIDDLRGDVDRMRRR